jgi:hypothetical protein
MKKIIDTDYILYNTKNKDAVRWHNDYSIVIYGDINEAKEDAKGSKYLQVVSCTSISKELQDELLIQINKH